MIATNLHLSGDTAQIVKDTFTTASSGKIAALGITVISLLVTGLDISAAAQTAYARAFAMTPLRGPQKYLRGGAWLVLLLAGTGAGLTLRSVTVGRPALFVLIAWAVWIAVEFGFFIITPRLLLDLPFAWRDLVPGAAVCTGAALAVHAVAAFFLRYWFGFYGHAYGGFGIGLALIAFTGIIASFWVWIAAVMGVYWERKAGPAAVAAMEKLSADVERTVDDQVAGDELHPPEAGAPARSRAISRSPTPALATGEERQLSRLIPLGDATALARGRS